MDLARELASSEANQRRPPRLLRRHTGLFVFRSKQIHVGGKLLIKIVVQPRLGKDGPQAGKERAESITHREGSFCAAKKRAITMESCSQFSAVSASRREPRRVIE